jgi:hypothetical protein
MGKLEVGKKRRGSKKTIKVQKILKMVKNISSK